MLKVTIYIYIYIIMYMTISVHDHNHYALQYCNGNGNVGAKSLESELYLQERLSYYGARRKRETKVHKEKLATTNNSFVLSVQEIEQLVQKLRADYDQLLALPDCEIT